MSRVGRGRPRGRCSSTDRVDALGTDHTDAGDLSVLGRVMRKLQSANEEFARAAA